MQFQRKTDEWGKLFSIVPSVAKLFPEKSNYQPARDLSLYLYTFFKVFFSVNRIPHSNDNKQENNYCFVITFRN